MDLVSSLLSNSTDTLSRSTSGNSTDTTSLGILQGDVLPYVLAAVLLIVGLLGFLVAFLVIVGYVQIGVHKQAHTLIYVTIAACCFVHSLHSVSVSVGLVTYTVIQNDTNGTFEKVLCNFQTLTRSFPQALLVFSYIIGMSGRIIATYAPLEYYRYFRYKVVLRLIVIVTIISFTYMMLDVFVENPAYTGNVGMCVSNQLDSNSYGTVTLISNTLIKILSAIFLITSYVLIVKKYVLQRVHVAGNLSDDSSKGIIVAAGSYGLLSLFVPQNLLIVLYLLANITIGVYMLKERNLTSSDSMHNKETFFFLRLTTVFLFTLCVYCAYYIIYIFYHISGHKTESEILKTEYNAIIMFYCKEVTFNVLSLINMLQMWKHTRRLHEDLQRGFFENLADRGAFSMSWAKGTKFKAYMKMNNVKKPEIFKRKRKIVRKGGRLKLTKRKKYHDEPPPPPPPPPTPPPPSPPPPPKTSSPGGSKSGSLRKVSKGQGLKGSLKRLGTKKEPNNGARRGSKGSDRAPGNKQKRSSAGSTSIGIIPEV